MTPPPLRSVTRIGRALALALFLGGCDEPARPALLAPAITANVPAPLPEVGPIERLLDGGSPSGVVRRGELVYVADGRGVAVYRVLEGGRVEREYHEPTPGNASGVAIAGSTLYVADGRAGLALFSLEIPDRPALVGRLALGAAIKIQKVYGSEHGVAALLEGGSIAIVRPGRPPERLSLPGDPRGAAWIGRDLYIADTGDGLLRVELDPAPAHIASRDRSFRFAIALAEHEGRLFVGYQDKRVELFDVSRPFAAARGSVVVDHLPSQIFVLGGHAIVAGREDRGRGATLLEIVAPASLEVRGKDTSLMTGAARVDESLALVAQGAAGLSLYSLASLEGSRSIVEPGSVIDRVSGDDHTVVAWAEDREGALAWRTDTGAAQSGIEGAPIRQAIPCGDAVCTLDTAGQICHQRLSPPDGSRPPKACTHVADGGLAIAWQPDAGRLWVLDASGALQGFVKAGDEEAFRRVAASARPHTSARESLGRLVIEGDRAAVIDASLGLLRVLDLGDSPRRRGTFLLQGPPSAVALANGVALVATRSGLQLIDVTNADRPAEIGWIPLSPGPLGVAAWWPGARLGEAREARVALAEGEDGFSLWSWDGRGALSVIARSDTTGVASGALFAAGSLWVADGTGMIRCRLAEAGP